MKRYRDLLDQRLAPLRTRFEALQQREQLFVAAAILVAAVALVYLLIWKPAAVAATHAERDLQASRSIAQRLEVIGTNQGVGRVGGPLVSPDASLLSAVDLAAKSGTLGKAPSGLQPDGDNQVRVRVDGVAFDALVRWVNELQTRYGIRVDALDVERQAMPGTVNARLTLMRGP